jgi:hypothetical protein
MYHIHNNIQLITHTHVPYPWVHHQISMNTCIHSISVTHNINRYLWIHTPRDIYKHTHTHANYQISWHIHQEISEHTHTRVDIYAQQHRMPIHIFSIRYPCAYTPLDICTHNINHLFTYTPADTSTHVHYQFHSHIHLLIFVHMYTIKYLCKNIDHQLHTTHSTNIQNHIYRQLKVLQKGGGYTSLCP